MRRYFQPAPWPTALVVISLLGSAVLCMVGFAAWAAAPPQPGFTRGFGIGVALIPFLVPVIALLFVVRGYEVERQRLCVRRLFTNTCIPLSGLQRVWTDPEACRGSLRLFGNGGLFAFTGVYQNARLGRYRLFATDMRRAVVLQFSDRVVVLSPADPSAFITWLRHLFPALEVTPP